MSFIMIDDTIYNLDSFSTIKYGLGLDYNKKGRLEEHPMITLLKINSDKTIRIPFENEKDMLSCWRDIVVKAVNNE